MLSAKRKAQLTVLCLCGALVGGSITGCATTQEKAAAQQAEAEQILKAREKRQQDRHEKEGR